ncbi:hypothetical protein [Streptomyces sp. NPDC058614]|uniref:hypothetical protein n=1 Tax=Streptomyces sp. NPDC058614 TaxID=3346557 RepID=UPI003658014C
MTAPHKRTARSGCDLRMLRAAVFAAVCVVLAAAGHVLASSVTVPLWTLGAGFLTVFAVTAPLAGRERSLPGIAAVLATGQTVLHTLFGLGQHGGTAMGATTASATGSGMADASLVERAARLVCGATAAAISPAQAQKILAEARIDTGMAQSMHHPADSMSATAGSSMSVLPSVPMLVCHLLAAVAAGWVLRRGDMALLRLIRLSAHGVAEGALVRSLRAALALVRALRAGLPGTPGAAPRTPLPVLLAPPKPRTTALQHTVIRRGPPYSTSLVLAA